MRLTCILTLFLLTLNLANSARRRKNEQLRVNIKTTPLYSQIVGDLKATTDYLEMHDGYLLPSLVKILLEPFLRISARNKSFLSSTKLCKIIHAFALDELTIKGERIEILVDLMVDAFNVDEYCSFSGLVLLWQLDWLIHLSFQFSLEHSIIQYLISSKIKVMRVMKNTNFRYWGNVVSLGSIPFSKYIVNNKGLFTNVSLAYDLKEDYEWPNVIHRIGSILASSPEPGRYSLRALAELLPQLMIILGRLNDLDESFAMSLINKLSNKWFLVSDPLQLTFLLQLMGFSKQFFGGNLVKFLTVTSKRVTKRVFAAFFENSKPQEIFHVITLLQDSPYFFFFFLGVYSKVKGPGRNREFENIYDELRHFNIDKLPAKDADLPKMGKFFGYFIVKFFDNFKVDFSENHSTLLDIVLFLFKADSEAGRRILFQFYEGCFSDEQVEKIRKYTKILVCMYFRNNLLEEPIIINTLIMHLKSHSTAEMMEFEVSLQRIAGTFIFEATKNGLPDRDFSSLFGNILKTEEFLEMSPCNKRILSIKLEPELIFSLALALAYVNAKNFPEEEEKAFPTNLILFIKEDWPVFDRIAMCDLLLRIFPQVREAFSEYDSNLSLDSLFHQARAFLKGNQFLWVLRCLVKEMAEYIRYIKSKELSIAEREIVESIYANCKRDLVNETDMDERLWKLAEGLSVSTNPKLFEHSFINRILNVVYPKNDDISRYYRMIARDYLFCMLSHNTILMSNPRKLIGSSAHDSLFKTGLIGFNPIGKFSKQIMACVLMSKFTRPSPEELEFISSTRVEHNAKQVLDYFLVCKSRYYVSYAPEFESAAFLGINSSCEIFDLFLDVPNDRIVNILHFLIDHKNKVSNYDQKHFKKIAFSLVLNANFYNFVPIMLDVETLNILSSGSARDNELCKRFVHLIGLMVLSTFDKLENKLDGNESNMFGLALESFTENPQIMKYFLGSMIRKPFRDEAFISEYIKEMLSDPLSFITRRNEREINTELSNPDQLSLDKDSENSRPSNAQRDKKNFRKANEKKKGEIPTGQSGKKGPNEKKAKSSPPIPSDKMVRDQNEIENSIIENRQELQSICSYRPRSIVRENIVAKESKIEDLFKFDRFGFATPKGNLKNEDFQKILDLIENDGFPFCLTSKFYEFLSSKRLGICRLSLASQRKWIEKLRQRPIQQLRSRTDLWKCSKGELKIKIIIRKITYRVLRIEDVAEMLRNLNDKILSRIQSLSFYSSGGRLRTLSFAWCPGKLVKVRDGIINLGVSFSWSEIGNALIESLSDESINARKFATGTKSESSEEPGKPDFPEEDKEESPGEQDDLEYCGADNALNSISLSELTDSTLESFETGSEDMIASQEATRTLHASLGELNNRKDSSLSLPVKSLSSDSLHAELIPVPFKTYSLNVNARPFVPESRTKMKWHPIDRIRSWNFASFVNQITRSNLEAMLPILYEAISECTMLSFDYEMSGLFPPSDRTPAQGFINNFEKINFGAHELFQLLQMGMTLWRQQGEITLVSIWSAMLCEGEKPDDVFYDPIALEKITKHGFRINSFKEECIDTFSFMQGLYPLIKEKPLIVHNGLADFIHLIKTSLDGKRFITEAEFLDFLNGDVNFFDTKAIAVYFKKIQACHSDLESLARMVLRFDFDHVQVHEASFDSFLTLKLFLHFMRDQQPHYPFEKNVLFSNK